MARQTPGDLADEILPDGGPWFLDSALLRPHEPKTPSYVSVSLFDAAAAACWTGIMLDRGALQKGRGAAGAIKRSGYEMRGPVYATRPLRGLRELDAEVRRIEALACAERRRERPLGGPSRLRALSTIWCRRLGRRQRGAGAYAVRMATYWPSSPTRLT
jgi:hypothetical protein